MTIKWRDILQSLLNSRKGKLDNPAVIEIDGEEINFDVLEIKPDDNLVAFPVNEINTQKKNEKHNRI